MKAKEVKEMTSEELVAKLAELKSELFNLRFRLASHKLPVKCKFVKKEAVAEVAAEGGEQQ